VFPNCNAIRLDAHRDIRKWSSPVTDAIVRPIVFASSADLRRRLAELLRRSLSRTLIVPKTADDTPSTLEDLPDNVLKDLGLARAELRSVTVVPASADARDRLNRRVLERDTATRLSHVALRLL
jgi:hypothetical protein